MALLLELVCIPYYNIYGVTILPNTGIIGAPRIVIKADGVHASVLINAKYPMEIVSKTQEWICFIPPHRVVPGHVCFCQLNSDIGESPEDFGKMYGAAVQYGKSMTAIGFYTDYKIFYLVGNMHLVPGVEGVNLPQDWYKLLLISDSLIQVNEFDNISHLWYSDTYP